MSSKFTKLLFISILCLQAQFTAAQISPWGTGAVNNQLIGSLDNSTVVFASQSGWGNYGYYPDPDTLLPTYTYDIYIPPAYDGTEPYGLVTFINSGNGGNMISQWQSVFDEKKLIYIGGDNIGNSINVNIRMGVAMAAVYRLKEVLNIDSTRIYTSGNSGGARMATVLAYTYPEWFFGSLPNCGSSYPQQVAQDYETQTPNGHYEYTIPFTAGDLTYIKSFDRRYAIMTAYNDFREGDIMNIYHNGMVPDGFKGKFLETPGGHCATTTQHFRDAVNFVEHPHITFVDDNFDATPTVGNGFKLKNTLNQNSTLVLNHNGAAKASAYSRDPFLWNEEKGSIFSTSVFCDSATYNSNSKFHIGLMDFNNATLFCDNIGFEVIPFTSSIVTTIVYESTSPTLLVIIENPNQSIASDTIFQATFSDWYIADTIDIKYHLWNQEIRMEFGKHMDTPTISSAAANLLDDNRSIRINWESFGLSGSYWSATDWQDGTLLTLASESIDTNATSTFISIDHVNVISADTSNINPLIPETVLITQNNNTLIAPTGMDTYQWYLDGVAIINDTTNTLQVSLNGDYTLSAYTGSICEVFSDTISMTIVSTFNIEQENKITIYPNPNQGAFSIHSNFNTPCDLEIYNSLGQIVLQTTINNATHQVVLNDKNKGIYFVKIKETNASKVHLQKVILY
jgi:hypothetical protein